MSTKYLIKNASITTFWRSLGIISGAALDAVVLAHFGLGTDTDALFASLAIPVLVTSALEIQVPKVLIPVLTRCTEEEGNETAGGLVSSLSIAFVSVLFAGALVLSVLSHLLIRLQAPGFSLQTVHMGVRLFLILAWLIVVQGVGPVFSSFLYSRHRYAVPSLGKLMTTFPAILTVVLYSNRIGIYAVAIGMLVGSSVQLCLLVIAAQANGLKWSLSGSLVNRKVLEVVKMLGHPMLGHIVSESKTFVENCLASLLGGGSLSVLRYATRIVEAISGVLLAGIVTSSLPLISVYTSEEKLGEMKRSVRDAIRLILFIALPIACWLIFTGQPMIVLLFQRGKFTGIDATHTAILIALLTPYIVFARLIGITQTPFYAKFDTKTPLVTMLMFFGLYIALIMLLSRTLGIYGFAIASSIASAATAVAMSALLQRTFGPLGWSLLKRFGFRMSMAMAFMIVAFVLGHVISAPFLSESLGDKLIRFLVPTAFGFAAFFTASVGFDLLGKRHLNALVAR